VKIENLDLPLLRELYLHRNSITSIGDLSGCPKIRKLWLFQNKLTAITGLHALPELEECWLQANQIGLLDGLEHNQQIVYLGMAGNPVESFQELIKLTDCMNLRELSFSDIHFGRSTVVDCDGYKEFVTLHLTQVRILDGVKLSKGAQQFAEDSYKAQIKAFCVSLQEVEEDYAQNIRSISSQHQVCCLC
jgi:Leucine-rich repeat (LRR) protein